MLAAKAALMLPLALVSACGVGQTPASTSTPRAEPTATSSPAESTATSTPARPSGPQPLAISLEIEFWDKADFRKVSPGVCALKKKSSNRRDVAFNQSVVLVGPDDSETASTRFGRGQLGRTITQDDGTFTNYPTRNVCRFRAIFKSVPPVDTYRVKFRGSGISDLSYDYDLVREYAGNVKGQGLMVMVLGADLAD